MVCEGAVVLVVAVTTAVSEAIRPARRFLRRMVPSCRERLGEQGEWLWVVGLSEALFRCCAVRCTLRR